MSNVMCYVSYVTCHVSHVDDNKRLTDSLSIQSHYRAKKDLGLDILTTSIITPIYRAPENGAHSITDAAAKLVPTFSADLNSGPESDHILEDFLSLAYKISAQNTGRDRTGQSTVITAATR